MRSRSAVLQPLKIYFYLDGSNFYEATTRDNVIANRNCDSFDTRKYCGFADST